MNYCDLETFLKSRLPHTKTQIIGKSVLKRNIYSVFIDFKCKKTVIIQGSLHAREHITTLLICKLIKQISNRYDKYKKMGVPNIIFVPMANPDGVELCYKGIESVDNFQTKKELIQVNGGLDFSLFKANINCVDLNTNFDANWGMGKENKSEKSTSGYVGKYPMSEPEVQILANLTNKIKPFFTISYHCKGQEIYYQFYNKEENLKRDKKIAKLISKTTGYKIRNCEDVSSGGYKDWCIQKFNIPSVTIEVGKDSLNHPLTNNQIKQIFNRNKNIIKTLAKIKKVYTDDRKRKIYERGN